MQPEAFGDLLAHVHAPHAVAVGIEAGREDAAIPNLAGMTARMPPLTPHLAGTPTSKAHCPAKSYMPHVYITLKASLTLRAASARSPVTGFTPPFARVAAIRARSRQVTRTEQWRR